jgi:hypothetical protein
VQFYQASQRHIPKYSNNLDDWLTVHRSITLVDFQLDAQNSYIFIHNTFIYLYLPIYNTFIQILKNVLYINK